MPHFRRLASALAVALFVFQATSAPPAEPPALAGVEFLTGTWVAETAATRVEESWLCPAADTMIGMGRTTNGTTGRTISFEYLRIEKRDEVLVYVAQPKGGRPTEFRLVRSGVGTATFENLTHDFPKRIVYSKEGPGTLVARVEGDASAGAKAEEVRYQRAASSCR